MILSDPSTRAPRLSRVGINLLLPGLAVLLTAAMGFHGGSSFAPLAAAPIPVGLAFAALAAAWPRPPTTEGPATAARRARGEAELIDDAERRIEAARASMVGRREFVHANADRLNSAARRMASEISEAARRAKSAVEATRAVSDSTHRVNSNSRTVTEAIAALDSRIADARGAVIDATRTTEATARAIDGLASRASEIGEIIGLIQAIAAESNLLALNATIEAARAGEAGRGFAGVARDVKALAHQAERTSGRIAERVAALQRATTGAVEAVATVGASVRHAEELTESAVAALRNEVDGLKELPPAASRAAMETALAAQALEDLDRQLGQADAALAELHHAVEDAEAPRAEFDHPASC